MYNIFYIYLLVNATVDVKYIRLHSDVESGWVGGTNKVAFVYHPLSHHVTINTHPT